MAKRAVKKVRMDDEMKTALAELAAEVGVSEGEIMREALRKLIRLHKRKKNMHLLIEQAIAVPGDDITMNWSLKK
jgi:hypothetical protein